MDAFSLDGHVSVVTGGNRGIGLGMAEGLAEAGAKVAVWGRSEEYNSAAVTELTTAGGDAVSFVCDVSDRSSVDAALAGTVEAYGKVDSLFANAGVSEGVRYEDMTQDQWDFVLGINVTGAHHSIQAVTNQMIAQGEGGSVVITASIAAHLGLPTAPHYSASKGAVLQLARALAVRLARHNIRVNAISPGWIRTEMTEEVQANEQMNQVALMRTPMRRWGLPEDFAGPAVFLASGASAFMTGSELMVDGGFAVS